MIRGVFILLLAVAYVHPSSPPYDFPPYAGSAGAIKDAINQVADQILSMAGNIPNITDSRRHYAIPLTHIFVTAQELAMSCLVNYERVYIEYLPDSISTALTSVEYIIEIALATIDSLNNNTREIQDLMEALCTKTTPSDVCNQVIHQTIEGDPDRYKLEANILLIAGNAATELIIADFVTVAEEYDEIDFLIYNMEYLQDLVMSIVDLIHLSGKRPKCA